MKKLDKKQVPQFIALCILSSGVFGYFVVRLVTPTPAAAGTRPRPVQESAKPSLAEASPSAKKTALVADMATDTDAAPVPAPTAGMRDPFVVGYVDPKTIPASTPPTTPAMPPLPNPSKAGTPQLASIQEVGPAPVSAPLVPSLPLGLKSFSSSPPAAGLPAAPSVPALPAVPTPPAWTVTGVLQNDTQHVAILRNGEARRIVRTGDFVDSQYRVVEVTRTSVALRHGMAVYHLMLGGVKTDPAPAKAMPAPAKFLPPIPATMMPVPRPATKPQNAASSPAQQSASLKGSLMAMLQSGLTLAQPFLAAARTRPVHPIAERQPVGTTITLYGIQVAQTLPAHDHSAN